MATIGAVRKQKDGSFIGHVKTSEMKRQIAITIEPIKGPKASEKHPDFRVVINGSGEAGAAWRNCMNLKAFVDRTAMQFL